MLRKIFVSASALGLSYFASAQIASVNVEESPKDSITKEEPSGSGFKVSGYVDAYYRFNFSNPKSSAETFNNPTSFTNSHNSFELGMASVKLEHAIGKVGMVADLGFGRRAEEFSYNDEGTLLAIKQAYLTYAPTANLKFTAGSFATHVGYELVDPNLNRNYSMSYMFSYGPFFHTGLKADLAFGKSGFMIGVTNPTDLKTASFSRKWLIAQYSYAPNDVLKLYVNYQGGNMEDDAKTRLRQIDAVLTGKVSDKFSIGYNGTIQGRAGQDGTGKYEDGNSWWGSALYLNLDPKPNLGFTIRGEYFDDKKDLLGFGSNMFETTLSANIKIGGLTLIPELRLDNASENTIFAKRNGSGTKSTLSGLFAAVYSF
jgi:hypothetical protein